MVHCNIQKCRYCRSVMVCPRSCSVLHAVPSKAKPLPANRLYFIDSLPLGIAKGKRNSNNLQHHQIKGHHKSCRINHNIFPLISIPNFILLLQITSQGPYVFPIAWKLWVSKEIGLEFFSGDIFHSIYTHHNSLHIPKY